MKLNSKTKLIFFLVYKILEKGNSISTKKKKTSKHQEYWYRKDISHPNSLQAIITLSEKKIYTRNVN